MTTKNLTENPAPQSVDSIDWLDTDLSESIEKVWEAHKEYVGGYWDGDWAITDETAEAFVRAVIAQQVKSNT